MNHDTGSGSGEDRHFSMIPYNANLTQEQIAAFNP